MKNKTTAGILGILLGGFGIHKFYLGQPGLGILYILFSWTFIPAIIGFIEGIIYLTQNDVEFINKYSPNSTYVEPRPSHNSFSISDLRELKTLLDEGAITEQEYTRKKKEILE